MSVLNISDIQSLLFGFCCLTGEERENVHALWKARFADNTAFLIDVEREEKLRNMIDQLEKAILAKNISGNQIQDRPVIITFFFDLTKTIDPEWLDSIWRIQARVDSYLTTRTGLILQFGFAGKLNLTSASLQKELAKSMIERNSKQAAAIQHRLCLIARPSLARNSKISWKAAMVLADVLRRQPAPWQLLPSSSTGIPNGDVMFLRYEEYDEEKRDVMSEKKRRIEHLLRDYDKQEFANQVNQVFSRFKKKATEQFPINGKAQPVHAGVIVSKTKKCFLSVDPAVKARRGKNVDYNIARDETIQAVMLTAERLERSILESYKPEIDDANKTLDEMMEKANLCIKLKRNRDDMHALLNDVTIEEVKIPDLPLRYSEAGHAGEIEDYLNAVKECAVNKAVNRMRNALIKAYDDIAEEKLTEEEGRLYRELGEVNSQLDIMQTGRAFCESIAYKRDPAICSFTCNVKADGDNVKMLICRNEKTNELLTAVDRNALGVKMYEINERGGGVQERDSAPLKALQVVALEGSEPVMDALLPDVEG